jgi:hypothetical protein
VIVPPNGRKAEEAVAKVGAALTGHLVEEVETGLMVSKARPEVRREFPDATGNGRRFRGTALLALTPTQVVLFGSNQRRPFLRAKTQLGMWPRDSIRVDVRAHALPISVGYTEDQVNMYAVRLRATDESIDIVLMTRVSERTAPLEAIVRATGGTPGDVDWTTS